MNNKPLLSIAIPTYNRATFLEKLLNYIAPQAKELDGIVEICISNNGSPDNTKEIVTNFKKKYPDLIKYNENEKNLGVDMNLIKIMEMSEGDFVWLLGDDDIVVDEGIKKVANFIKKYCNKDTGLITLANDLYYIDAETGKKVVYDDAIEKNKTEMFAVSRKDVIGECFPGSVFLSVLIYNNSFLKKILKEEKEIIKKAIGSQFVHTFIYRMMFLKYYDLQALGFNEIIVESELHYYKIYIDDIFKLYYVSLKKLDNLLLSSRYVDDYSRRIITNEKRGLMKGIVIGIMVKKAFGAFRLSSFSGCIKMLLKYATLADTLLFFALFLFFSVTPAFVLRDFYKFLIKTKYKKDWEKIWLNAVMKNSKMSTGSRRLTV